MNFQTKSTTLYTGAFAIALGIIALPDSASATVTRNVSSSPSPDTPTLLISDSEQITGIKPQEIQGVEPIVVASRAEKFENQEFNIASNRRLNDLVSANDKPELAPLINFASSQQEIKQKVEEVHSYQFNQEEFLEAKETKLNFNNPQSTTVAQSTGVAIPIYTPSQQNETAQNKDDTNEQSIAIQVIPADYSDQNPVKQDTFVDDPTNNSQIFNQPTLITNQQDFNLQSSKNKNNGDNNPGQKIAVIYPESEQTPVAEFVSDTEVASVPIQIDSYDPTNMPPAGNLGSPELPRHSSSPEQYLPETQRPFNGYIWPARGTFTSGWGPRWGRMHRGIDVAGPVGTPIVAAADGEVITSGWNSGGYGNWVRIRHPDGSITLYAHNQRNHVRRGQQVRQGQHIADMGSTGFSTGPHVHFEIHRNGRPTDPMAFLPSRR